MSEPRLEGLGVVVTRPRSAGEPLAAALAREGARTWLFPALAIEDVEPTVELQALLSGIARFDMAIFVSANAAEKGLAMASRFAPWPGSIRVAAIGEATAQALRNWGLANVISPPDRHDSEGLLALAQLQDVRGRNIIVFRGEGGRERLKEVARGARGRRDVRGVLSARASRCGSFGRRGGALARRGARGERPVRRDAG